MELKGVKGEVSIAARKGSLKTNAILTVNSTLTPP